MAEKLSWSELRRALAARANVSEKEANAFLTALNAQIIEALKSDKQVKINGLGTFKLQAVAPRKSVNVKTGEEITIEGYNKVAFVPEAGVKELVEKGSGTQTDKAAKTPETDPIQKLGAQAEEIVDLLGDLGQSPKAEEPVVEEPKPEDTVVVVEQPEVSVQPAEEPVAEDPKAEEPKQEEKPKKKSHFWRDTLICVVVLLILLVVGYFFLREQISGWVDSIVNGIHEKTEMQAGEANEDQNAVSFEDEQNAAGSVITNESDAEELEFTYTKLITTERLTNGSRLAWLARKYYGSPVYWPYIYAANRDRVSDPDMITIGTAIRVPKLTQEQLDTTNTQVIRLLDKLQRAN